MTRLHRALATGAAAVTATTLLSACSFFSPLQTDRLYNPADGVPVTIGDVTGVNLVVIAEREGGPGTLTGAVVNGGNQQVRVSFLTREASEQGEREGEPITLKARETRPLTDVDLGAIPAPPGALTDIYLVTPQGRQIVTVPVQLPTGPYSTIRVQTPTPTATSAPTTAPLTTATTAPPATTAPVTTAPVTAPVPSETPAAG